MNRTPVILVLEDDESDIIFLKRAFRKIDLRVPVQVAETGQEGINYLSGAGRYADREAYPFPTHLLMDLKLPERSGIEVLEWVHGEPSLRDLRIAILTSSSENRDLQRARELGAECYLVKPMSFAVLVDLCRSVDDWVRTGRCPAASQWSPEQVS